MSRSVRSPSPHFGSQYSGCPLHGSGSLSPGPPFLRALPLQRFCSPLPGVSPALFGSPVPWLSSPQASAPLYWGLLPYRSGPLSQQFSPSAPNARLPSPRGLLPLQSGSPFTRVPPPRFRSWILVSPPQFGSLLSRIPAELIVSPLPRVPPLRYGSLSRGVPSTFPLPCPVVVPHLSPVQLASAGASAGQALLSGSRAAPRRYSPRGTGKGLPDGAGWRTMERRLEAAAFSLQSGAEPLRPRKPPLCHLTI